MTPAQRSQAMARVPGKDTKPELTLRSALHRQGFRFRKNVKSLPGSPDIVLPKYKAAIFVHGCFWHGHEGCSKSNLPETRQEFWQEKLTKNILRDQNNIRSLQEQDWRVAVIWVCFLKNKDTLSKTVESLSGWIVSGKERSGISGA